MALSLCPMLAARILNKDKAEGESRATGPISRLGAWSVAVYAAILRVCLAAPFVVVACALAFALAGGVLFTTIKQELTPSEDRAVVIFSVTTPQGVSLDYTTSQLRGIEEIVKPYVERGEAENIFSLAGRGGAANSAFMVLTLSDWDKRSRTQQEIAAEISRKLDAVPGARAYAIQPNSLGIRGAGSGLQVALAGDDYGDLAIAADKLVQQMQADPRFGRVRLSYETTQPQLSISVDREKASDLGINISGLATVVQSMLDGRSIGSVFIKDRSVDVKLVSTSNPINDPTDLENIFLKTGDGRTVPMSAISALEERAVAPSLSREQKMRSISVTASLTPDFALQSALDRANELAAPLLPPGGRVIPLAEAATLNETSSSMARTFGFAIVVVLLVLAAQFESFVSAFIIMFTVPLGIACAVFALWFTGTSLNVYSQIGFVLMVGIMAKNGILIVEFANQLRDQGLSVRAAIEGAAIRRLRPVMMTMIATVVGGLPLVLAVGAGAEARISLGWVIVGGLGLATFATLFVTPVAYLIFARFATPQTEEAERLRRELDAAARGAAPAE